MRRSIIIILLTLITSVVHSQMLYSVDSASFMIGDQTTLTIHGAAQYPSAEQLTQNGIIALRQWFDTTDNNGKKEMVQHTLLTSFEEGEHWLKLSDNDSLMLTIRDVPNVDTASMEIRDIAPIMNEPYTFWEIFRWILLGLGIAALVALAIYIIKKVKAHEPIISLPQTPPVPPHEVALSDLERLRQAQLWQQGKVKEYHTELTDIVREYLNKELYIQSVEMTTDQTLDAFETSIAHSSETEEKLRTMLQRADMVKFAKSEPMPYEHDASMKQAVEFVTLCHDAVTIEKLQDEANRTSAEAQEKQIPQNNH